MIQRRNFIRKSILGIPALYWFNACITKKSKNIIEGEEWRTTYFSAPENNNTIPREEILATSISNIEKYRKGKFTLKLTDNNGDALTGKKFIIRQTDSIFDWGCSAAGKLSALNKPQEIKRSHHFKELFNCTTVKCYWNEKWHQPIEKNEGEKIPDLFLDEIAWAKKYGLRIKGHPLVWTVRKALPTWLDKYEYPETLNKVKEHIRYLLETGGNDVTHWDLCNEMLWEPSLRNYKKRHWPHIETTDEILTYLEPCINYARQVYPNAIYSLNDYGLEVTYRSEITAEEQRKRYVELVQKMKNRNCAPDAIGTQAHVAGWYLPHTFKQSLDCLSQAEVPIQITEFWAHINNQKELKNLTPEEQEEKLITYITDMYTIAFGHASVNHFTYWGDEHFFNPDGSPTPVYKALYNLIKEKWTTNTEAVSDNTGTIYFNGFYGNYTIHEIQSQKETEFTTNKTTDIITLKLS